MDSLIEKKYRADVIVKLEGCPIQFQIDTGASVNVLDENDLPKVRSKIKIARTEKKILAYGSRIPLPSLGKFQATVETKRRFAIVTFYIAKRTSKCMGSLLELQSAVSLGLIYIVNNVENKKVVDQNNANLNAILKDYAP